MTDRSIVVRGVQPHSVHDPKENLREVLPMIARAEADGVDLLVLPETAASRTDDPTQRCVAEGLDDGFAQAIARTTHGMNLTVVFGMIERVQGSERRRNTLVAMRDGEMTAVYHKLHLYDAHTSRESKGILPGDAAPEPFTVAGVRIGLQNCYDLRFPETSRVLADRGAEVLVVPTSWVRGANKEDHWNLLLRARAVENTCFVLGVGQTGGNRIGLSAAIGPDGVCRAGLGHEIGEFTCTFDLGLLEQTRAAMPLLRQRRFAIDPVPRQAPTIFESSTD